jgi:peptide/nickel transport system substrate-binding protein
VIRRALLALGAGGLLVIAVILGLIFRSVLLAPERPRAGGNYTEGMVGRLGSFNPLFAQGDGNALDVDALLFEPLVRIQSTGQVDRVLVASWEVSPDQRNYTFAVRPNARWSDGAMVTADDVLFTVRTVQDPDYPGVFLGTSWKDIVATAIDSQHVRFTLPGRNASFLATLAQLDILPSHALAGLPVSQIAASPFGTHPVGTGPFRVRDRLPDGVVLERNPFSRLHPWLDGIVIRTFPDEATALSAMDRHEIDGVANLSAAGAARARRMGQVSVYTAATYRYLELLFNLKADVPYFQDKQVRRAIAMAINRQAIMDTFVAGDARPATGPIPSAITWAYDPTVKAPTYDPLAAAQLLDQAGWMLQGASRVRAGVSMHVELVVPRDVAPFEQIGRQVAQDLGKVGIRVDVTTVTADDLVRLFLNPRTFQLALTAFDNGPDPDVYAFWHSSESHPGGFNFTGMKRNVFIDLDLEKGRADTDLAVRAAAYRDLQQLFAEEVPAVYLYSPNFCFAVSQRIRGIRVDAAVEPPDRYTHVSDWYVEVGR